ncbi:hypothetical protein [Pseudobacillus badius]|uniref:hypothetical protein n=1 Tax=Bacillus badius TaxID=1455 RepID=UPI003D34DFDB
MLKLLVNNKEEVTCRSSCHLFNKKHNCCPIIREVSYDDPLLPKRCRNFQYKNSTEPVLTTGGSESSEVSFSFVIAGDRGGNENYPNSPSDPVSGVPMNVFWHTDVSGTYGCWILNESASGLMKLPRSVDDVEKGWAKGVYRSPLPLHDHQCRHELRSRICWYVDHDGWGQYAILIGNQIGYLEHPRPGY